MDAGTNLAIDGIRPAATATPETAPELASILAEHARGGATIVPFGGATSLGLGNVPERVDLALATGALARVLAYEPSDLTLSIEAGATVAAIQRLLTEHGQALPIDVPFPERATIGGVIATGYAGPRRLRDGTVRDLLLGTGFARMDGSLAKSGGLVVKNVSGFDLGRLMHGALGTLGVLTSVNLKVLPAAKADRTLLVRGDGDARQIGAVADALCRLPVRPTSVEIFLGRGAPLLALRYCGREKGVAEQIQEVQSHLRSHDLSVTEERVGNDSRDWWQESIDHWAEERPNTAQFLLTVRPRNVGSLVKYLEHVAQDDAANLEANCSVGLGMARLNVAVPPADQARWLGVQLREWLGHADDVVVQFAPAEAKQGLDVWGRGASGLAVMRDLKRELDPSGALNRGRFMGFI